MPIYSIQKDTQHTSLTKLKIIKNIQNKLSPINSNHKYPMGQNSFLEFKNLQKTPQLDLSSFHLKSYKQNLQTNIINALINKSLANNNKPIAQKVYDNPKTWIKLYTKTAGQFQNSYLTSRMIKQKDLQFPQQTRYPQTFRQKLRYRSSQHISMRKSTKMLLKKVETYKKIKTKQICENKKLKRCSNTIKPNQQFQKQNNLFLTQNKKQFNQQRLQQSAKELQKQQKLQIEQDQLLKEKEIKSDWVNLITNFILKKHTDKSQEQKIQEQLKQRKKQNKLKQFIGIFQRNKKGFYSEHIQKSQDELKKPFEQQRKLKVMLQNINKKQQNNHQQLINQVVSYTNPIVKLRRLQSICKNVQNKQKIKTYQQIEQEKDNNLLNTCSKIRINSNHKRIIGTCKPVCNA